MPTSLGTSCDRGFETIANLVDPETVTAIVNELDSLNLPPRRGGIRTIARMVPSVWDLVASSQLMTAAGTYLAGVPHIVRVILFDKTPTNNWLVSWHQDKTIAVSKAQTLKGWGPWSVKDGIHHVQPPLSILENTITFRIHLDDATPDTGCLRVIPNTHQLGILTPQAIRDIAATSPAEDCPASAGTILAMRPLLLHASSRAKAPSHRRVIHVEYCGSSLPDGLEWVCPQSAVN